MIAIYKTPLLAMQCAHCGGNPNFAKCAGISVRRARSWRRRSSERLQRNGQGPWKYWGKIYERTRFRWPANAEHGFDSGLIVAVMAHPQSGVSSSWRAAAGIHPDQGLISITHFSYRLNIPARFVSLIITGNYIILFDCNRGVPDNPV